MYQQYQKSSNLITYWGWSKGNLEKTYLDHRIRRTDTIEAKKILNNIYGKDIKFHKQLIKGNREFAPYNQHLQIEEDTRVLQQTS